MADVVVYSRPWCGYCRRAKRVLEQYGLDYREVLIDGDVELEKEMIRRSGGRYTVPQIFIDDEHIGGSDELVALAARGGLDRRIDGGSGANEETRREGS